MTMRSVSFALFLVCLLAIAPNGLTENGVEMHGQTSPAIPGITSEDPFPRGCVDCHVNRPDIDKDVRISVAMMRWYKVVEPRLVERLQPVTPSGVKLKGVHPPAAGALRDIPAGCMKCHSEAPGVAIPLSAMMHIIHLVGGKDNHFLTIFQGQCTYCHKFNPAKGAWSVPSGPEK